MRLYSFENIQFVFFLLLINLTAVISFAQTDSANETISTNFDAQKLFIDGKTFELQYNYSGALENYRAALKFDNAPGIYYAIARVYFTSGKMQESMIEINNALKFSPEEIKYLELKGNIFYADEKYEKAAEIYEQIVTLQPDYIFALYFLARVYQELRTPSKAIVIYEKITDIAGFDYDVLKRMYEIYYNYKEFDKCLEVLQYFAKLDPYDAATKQQLAGLYLKN